MIIKPDFYGEKITSYYGFNLRRKPFNNRHVDSWTKPRHDTTWPAKSFFCYKWASGHLSKRAAGVTTSEEVKFFLHDCWLK